MSVISINDLDDPRLEVYRNLNKSRHSRSSDVFVAEGRWLVERLLQSRLSTESILLNAQYAEEFYRLVGDSIPIYSVPHDNVSKIIGFQFHRGVLAVGRRPKNEALENMLAAKNPLLVACPEIVDPTNLGGIIRSCSAFGVDGLILGPTGADPFSRRVARVAMGNSFSLAIRMADDFQADLTRLQQEFDFELLATVLDPDAESLPQSKRAHRTVVLFGGEGHGLSREVIDQCNRKVSLPMQMGTDSLNVASAASVFLYHYAMVAEQK